MTPAISAATPSPVSTTHRLLWQSGIGLITVVAYVMAAKLGFGLAFAAEQVTTVWAPTGIAEAVLLLYGMRLWPAIWIGAFIANAGTAAPLWVAAVIAVGNTLEAVATAWVLRRVDGFDPALRRIRDAVGFAAIGAMGAPVISATIGVTALVVAQVQPASQFATLWSDWWLGDAVGALIVAPAILTVARTPAAPSIRTRIEGMLLVAATAVATYMLFGGPGDAAAGHHPLEFAIFPMVITAAVRVGQPATALMVAVAAAGAILQTSRGSGPFGGAEIHTNLVLLQVFLGVLAGTGCLLAAAIGEQQTGERRRGAAYAVNDALAKHANLNDAAEAIVGGICRHLGWSFGALWVVDREQQRLTCIAISNDDPVRGAAFEAATRQTRFVRGTGLPGRVWATARAAWIEDVVHDTNFPRVASARLAGIHGAFAFPIRLGDDVLGVIECFNRSRFAPDTDLLRTLSAVGGEIGQFIGRTQVERDAAAEQRNSRAIVDTALDAVIGMDHRGVITEFNPAAERMFAYRRADAVGRELADLIIPPSLRESHREGLSRYLATGRGPFIDARVETHAWKADGREFPVEVSITRIPQHEPPRFTGFVRDLTARAALEREREQLLARESAARREAEAANRAKDEFLATLSHELRTPLNAIVGWARLLLTGSMNEETTRRALEVIDRNANLQVRLIEDILDVSRIITGGLSLAIQKVDLTGAVTAALDAVRPAADAKGITLRSQFSGSARAADADPQRLQQILWNLLANAVKFTPAGGHVEIAVEDAAPDAIRFSVRDDGVGIDAGFLPYVFDRFRQADGSPTRQHGGLGLGLAIVRHLVELHGGTVHAVSEGLNRGATFVVELPRRALTAPSSAPQGLGPNGDTRAAAAAPASIAGPLDGCRILVVDDEKDSRELLALVLTTAGASVASAGDAKTARERAESWQPHVVLTDIGMAGEDGYQLLRSLSPPAGAPRPVIAAVTAYAGEAQRARAEQAGFDAFFPKPIESAELIKAVARLWRSKQAGTGG